MIHLTLNESWELFSGTCPYINSKVGILTCGAIKDGKLVFTASPNLFSDFPISINGHSSSSSQTPGLIPLFHWCSYLTHCQATLKLSPKFSQICLFLPIFISTAIVQSLISSAQTLFCLLPDSSCSRSDSQETWITSEILVDKILETSTQFWE